MRCPASQPWHRWLGRTATSRSGLAGLDPTRLAARLSVGRTGRPGASEPIAAGHGRRGSCTAASAEPARTLDPRRQLRRGLGELHDDRPHRRPVGPGGVEHVGRPDHRLARRHARALLADAHPAAALDHDEPASVCGFAWGAMRACRPKASSAMTPGRAALDDLALDRRPCRADRPGAGGRPRTAGPRSARRRRRGARGAGYRRRRRRRESSCGSSPRGARSAARVK